MFAEIGKGTVLANRIADFVGEEFQWLIQEGCTFWVYYAICKIATLMSSGVEKVLPQKLDSPTYLCRVSGDNTALDGIALYVKNDDTPARIFR